MPLEFVLSERGNDMLLLNGYIHKKERKIGDKIIWKCASYNRRRCPGRAHTQGDEVLKIMSHNHETDPPTKGIKLAMKVKKETAKHTEVTMQAVGESLPQSAVEQKPDTVLLNRTIQRVRRKTEIAPVPTSLMELNIPYEYRETDHGEPFLLYDSGPDEKRILIFSTETNLELMTTSEDWYANGTFTCTPQLFQQLYTIHAVQYDNVIPIVYALLPEKTEETYVHFLQELKRLQPDLRPKSIVTDFEGASVNALRREFPDSHLRSCFFHFSQSLWTNIQSANLQNRYTQDSDFALQLRQLAALVFVPEKDVVGAYEELLDSNFFCDNEDILTPVLNHFEDTWIGRYDRRGYRRPPTIPIRHWNLYDRARLGLLRINNSVEGWHKGFNASISSSHPSIWKLMNAIKREEAVSRLKVKQYISGSQPAKKKVCTDTSERIKKIVQDYETKPILEYLRDIAHNLQLQI